jgi:DNA-binding transcriptional LysR family regulator
VTLTIIEREDAEALRDLRLGAVDVVLTQEYAHLSADRDDRLTYQPLATDSLRLVLPPGSSPDVTVAQLGDTPWLLNGIDTRCTASTRRLLRNAGIDPMIDGLVADNGTLLALVAAGRGVTIVPELVLRGSDHGVVVSTQDLDTTRTILAVHRRASAPALAPLLAELTTVIDQ